MNSWPYTKSSMCAYNECVANIAELAYLGASLASVHSRTKACT